MVKSNATSLILHGIFKNGNIIKLNVPQYCQQQLWTEGYLIETETNIFIFGLITHDAA
jgi:hypothetical protein